jgi:hypothetical protein
MKLKASDRNVKQVLLGMGTSRSGGRGYERVNVAKVFCTHV